MLTYHSLNVNLLKIDQLDEQATLHMSQNRFQAMTFCADEKRKMMLVSELDLSEGQLARIKVSYIQTQAATSSTLAGSAATA